MQNYDPQYEAQNEQDANYAEYVAAGFEQQPEPPKTSAQYLILESGKVQAVLVNTTTGTKHVFTAENEEQAARIRKGWEEMGCPDMLVGGEVSDLRERHKDRFPVSDANDSDPCDLNHSF